MKEEQKRQVEATTFKARPNTVIHKEPFQPKKENRCAAGKWAEWRDAVALPGGITNAPSLQPNGTLFDASEPLFNYPSSNRQCHLYLTPFLLSL